MFKKKTVITKKVTKKKVSETPETATKKVVVPKKVVAPKEVVAPKKVAAPKEVAAPKRGVGAPKASEQYKFTAGNLAEDLKLSIIEVRKRLRIAQVPRPGRAYGWNTVKDYKAVLRQIKNL
jgi:hypothetical protein